MKGEDRFWRGGRGRKERRGSGGKEKGGRSGHWDSHSVNKNICLPHQGLAPSLVYMSGTCTVKTLFNPV